MSMKTKALILLTLVVFLTGLLGLAQPGEAARKKKPAVSPVGVVDYSILLNQHPDKPEADNRLQAEHEQAKQEYDSKAAGLSDAGKQELELQLRQRLEQKRQELLTAITTKIDAAIREVAAAEGITVVVQKNATIYGGKDITSNVLEKLTKTK